MSARVMLFFSALALSLAACNASSGPERLPVASVRVTPESASMQVGTTLQLGATPVDFRGNLLPDRVVVWRSTNPGIATVSATGLVTAVSLGGPVAIVATSEGQDGVARIYVVPPPVASVTVAPATGTLTVGATLQLSAILRDAQGNLLTGRAVSWTSANPTIATVSGAGLVTGVAPGGPVAISATSEGITGAMSLTVLPSDVDTVVVTPVQFWVRAGTTFPLAATARDRNGVIVTGVPLAWSSSNTAVATVSGTGLVTGVAVGGPIQISATAGGRRGSSQITITTEPCDGSLPVSLGQAVAGTLTDGDCLLADSSFADLYLYLPAQRTRVQFDLASTAFDAYLLLFEIQPDGSVIAVGADDNSGGGSNARLVRDVPAGTWLLIAANSFLPRQGGAYQLSLAASASSAPLVAASLDDWRQPRASIKARALQRPRR